MNDRFVLVRPLQQRPYTRLEEVEDTRTGRLCICKRTKLDADPRILRLSKQGTERGFRPGAAQFAKDLRQNVFRLDLRPGQGAEFQSQFGMGRRLFPEPEHAGAKRGGLAGQRFLSQPFRRFVRGEQRFI